MHRVIQSCDRCKKEAEGAEAIGLLGLSSITIGRKAQYSSYSGNYVSSANQLWEGEWCRDCCKAVGVDLVICEPVVKGAFTQPVPTIEEMVREIVREELPK